MDRSLKDEGRDRSLADEAKERADVAELHTMVLRLLEDRRQLAEAFDSMIRGWSIMQGSPNASAVHVQDKDAIAAIQHVATEAIQLAREVIRSGRSEGMKDAGRGEGLR